MPHAINMTINMTDDGTAQFGPSSYVRRVVPSDLPKGCRALLLVLCRAPGYRSI